MDLSGVAPAPKRRRTSELALDMLKMRSAELRAIRRRQTEHLMLLGELSTIKSLPVYVTNAIAAFLPNPWHNLISQQSIIDFLVGVCRDMEGQLTGQRR